MSFTDMMSSGRGPGVIGMLMALVVLVGFGFLFMLASEEGAQGGHQSIESVIAQQATDIGRFQVGVTDGRQKLDQAPTRIENAKELARFKRENQARQSSIANLKGEVEAGKAELARRNEAFEGYKDQYRAFVRAKAKGESMDQLVTLSGVVYKDVNIREVTAIGIQIRHGDGQKRIPFEELPEAMKDHFQFDPEQKKKALAVELAGRVAHEEAVTVSGKQDDLAMAAKRIADAEAAKATTIRSIAQKEARLEAMDDEIKQLNKAILMESQKTVSRASIMRVELSNKRREVAELRAQISSLRGHL